MGTHQEKESQESIFNWKQLIVAIAEAIMKKKNNCFKVAYWIFIYALILTGCSNNHGAEEKTSVEDGKEEQVEEKIEEAEIAIQIVSDYYNQ